MKLDQLSKATGILMTGTALGQAILLLALPFLTRIYTPEEFNTLAIYVAIVGMFSGAACLRFDIAISIPESVDDSRKLLILSVLCAAVVSTVVALGVWLVGWFFAIDYGLGRVAFSFLIGVGVFSLGAFNAFHVWYIREKDFISISLVKLGQASASVAVQVVLGMIGGKAFGLVLGYLANSAVGAIWFALLLTKKAGAGTLSLLSFQDAKRLFASYSRFPKYSAVESLANEGASQMPVLLIAFLLGGAEAGFLMLAARVLQAPIGLLANAVSQVFLSQAPEKERQGQLAEFSVDMIVRLAKIGVGPLIFVGLLAPSIFPIIFGEQWARSGELISWMTPWFIVQFLVSPVSMSLHVKGRQKIALNLQLFSLLFRVFSVALCVVAFSGAVVEIYALSGLVVYLVYLLVVLKVLDVPTFKLIIALREALPSVMLFLLAGAVVMSLMPCLNIFLEHWLS